ncbi:SNF2 helicase associated domain-containing protein [Paenibacillus aurantius]|uniref:SNF2 helicase associated domain-containing protein n=1 Tax=Paenibacillus aurantius TaxID=2918900 RepID=A0AA96LCN6_9BACL|nr:SNF2 helicase associated domain-containing protein [Paenibacillus aurantius]WNQ10638.1 SNF2 helicase associated domain-containing protein [Paenibacillus aurantius]
MNEPIQEKTIRALCGRFACEDGEALFRAGSVNVTRRSGHRYEADVREDGSVYPVTLGLPSAGKAEAVCSCPVFHPDDLYCRHIAALLFWVKDGSGAGLEASLSGVGEAASAGEAGTGLSDRLLELFSRKPVPPTAARPFVDGREVLEAEFTVRTVPHRDRGLRFGVECRIGAKRLYAVKRIGEFLEQVERGEPYPLTGTFSYVPELHSFQPENDAVLRALLRIVRSEGEPEGSSYGGEGRMPLIPAAYWEGLLPLLAAAPQVKLVHDGLTYSGIGLTEEPLPLVFAFEPASEGAEDGRLEIRGSDRVTVMEAYGMILSEGRLRKPPAEELKRLAGLIRMLEETGMPSVRIPVEQMELFLEQVIPGLLKLGAVKVAQEVSERMVQAPLKAKLFLDRVKDRLLAGLEFHYGEWVVDPLESPGTRAGRGRLLVRDGEKEQRILSLMEQAAFLQTEGGYMLLGEEEEYEFLRHVLPELEKLVQVYATSAAKERLFTGHAPPRLRAEVDERTDWLEFRFELDGIPEREISRLLETLAEKRRYYRLPGGALMPLDSEEFQDIIRFLNSLGGRLELAGDRLRLPAAHAVHLMENAAPGRAVSLGTSFRRLLDTMRSPDHLEHPYPEGWEPVLRGYQKYGYQWLKTLARYRFGGVLADEMGLGKTVQSIAYLVSVLPELRETGEPALVVCPASLLYNWQRELRQFAPELRVTVADGGAKERSGILSDPAGADVIITSYPLLRRDLLRYMALSFHTVFYDEAQAFKNPDTQTARSVKAIRARHRFALTGTPLENRLEDLWSLYDVVFPGLLPDRKAFKEFSREAAAKRIRPFMLRRLKSDVLQELPEKIESTLAAELLPEQKKLYVAYLAELRQEAVKHLKAGSLRRNRIRILAGLTRLRQLCCHPALFVEGYRGSSAKFDQLLELVDEYRGLGRRVLIFSQFTEMLGLIRRELVEREVPYFYLDGQTPPLERVELCRRFNEGERDLFLLSLKAGGTGLNLTGADTVILYDLWWNPAVELQAMDRAHRIGQRKVVQVIRLVARGTVEDKMYALQQSKKALIGEVLQPAEEGLPSLTENEIRELLML